VVSRNKKPSGLDKNPEGIFALRAVRGGISLPVGVLPRFH
jgi:hypothetical protein